MRRSQTILTPKKLKLSTAILSVATALSGEAFAQSQQAMLEEVIVTAQKREQSLQDIPISITAFDTDQLKTMGVQQLIDVQEFTPNVLINKQPGTTTSYGLSIRGISNALTNVTAEPTVGLYQDGIYISRAAGAAFELVDLERIEVLRGPQGTLYGRNTIGGAINLISKQATGELGFQQKVSAGNRDYWLSRTTVDTPTVGGLYARLSYMRTAKDGFTESVYGGDNPGSEQSEAYRVALHWDVGESFNAVYSYDHSETESNPSTNQITGVKALQRSLGGPIYAQAAAVASADYVDRLYIQPKSDDASDTEVDAHALTLSWDLGNVLLKSITAYREVELFDRDTDFSSFPSDGVNVLDGTGGVIPEGELVSLFAASSNKYYDQFSQELQAIGGLFADRLNYTVGIYYHDEKGGESNPQAFVFPAQLAYGQLDQGIKSFLCQDPTFSDPNACLGKDTVLSSPIFNYEQNAESLAVYGQFEYAVTEKLNAAVGLRYTKEEKDATLNQSTIIRNEGAENVPVADDWSKLTPAVSLNYTWNEDVNSYLSYTTGYRAGGFNAASTSVTSWQTPYDEETVDSYEFGIKSGLFDNRLRLNGALFYYEYKDRQVAQFSAGSSGATSVINNAGESEAWGLELEFVAAPTDGLVLRGNVGYIDAQYNEFVTAIQDPDTGFNIGEGDISDFAEQSYSPELTASAAIDYRFQPFSFGTLAANLSATYQDEIFYHPLLNSATPNDAQTRINGRLSLSEVPLGAGNLEISLWGRNLTDEEHRAFGIDFGALGWAMNTFREERTYGIDLTYEY